MLKLVLIFIMSVCIGGFANPEKDASGSVSEKQVEAVSDQPGKTEASALLVSMKVAENPVLSANRVIVSVPGMVCQMCVHGMRKVFKDSVQNAEQDVQVDLDKKTVALNLAVALSDEDIKKKVVQAGYKVDKITRL